MTEPALLPATRHNIRTLSTWIAREKRKRKQREFFLWLPLPVIVGLMCVMIGIGLAPPSSALPPCPTEDSDNCRWDAGTQGNGLGRSFVVVDGLVTYDDE